MSFAIYAIVAVVAVQRLVEVRYAQRNTQALVARGAVEVGRSHYPLIVLLHVTWLVAILALVPDPAIIIWPWLALFVALQAARTWVIVSLGDYWTTRIVTLAHAPLVRTGPYRWLRHPNYVVVAGEIAVLPLAFGEWSVAIVFSILNTAVLAWRIREEEAALAGRRALSGGH